MVPITSQLPTWHLENRRVILRFDGNVPLQDGAIRDDYRLQQIQPTIDYLIAHKALIVLITHLGRPKNCDTALSTRHLIPWFENRSYRITYAPDIITVQSLQQTGYTGIILLENLRFFSGEKACDAIFAQQLASLGEYFVNDAFGTLHGLHASITGVPQFFQPYNKTCGFLVEQEIAQLLPIFSKNSQKTLMVMGGAKIPEKIAVIPGLMQIAQTFLLCPALVFTFLAALDQEVGNSLIDKNMLQTAQDIFIRAQKTNIAIHLPIDYQVEIPSASGNTTLCIMHNISKDGRGISVGPATIDEWRTQIQHAQTIIFNGVFGFEDNPATLAGIHALFTLFAQTSATTIVTGGDSVAYARQYGFADKMSLLSSGGGATLFFLSNGYLPGLDALFYGLKDRTKAQ